MTVDQFRPTFQPQRYDPYTYCANNPVGGTDPTGTLEGGWWPQFTVGPFTWQSDGYQFQEVDLIWYWCRSADECYGTLQDRATGKWFNGFDQYGNPILGDSPLTANVGPDAGSTLWGAWGKPLFPPDGWDVAIQSPNGNLYWFHWHELWTSTLLSFTATPLCTNLPPPDIITQASPQTVAAAQAARPAPPQQCADWLQWLCSLFGANGYGEQEATPASAEYNLKYIVGIGVALGCTFGTFGAGAFGCFAAGVAAGSLFNLVDLENGPQSGPGAAANYRDFLINEGLTVGVGYVGSLLPADDLLAEAAGVYATGPDAPFVPFIDQVAGPWPGSQ